MSRCANPECPNVYASVTLASHYVQVTEREFHSHGDRPVTADEMTTFAAVTCSKRCAVAVLLPLLDAEDRERAKLSDLFGK